MLYKVLASFTDKDTGEAYHRNDYYPADKVSEERLKELTTKDNARERVLIEKMESVGGQEVYPKQTKEGSSWYLLSNGEKVQGKEEAEKAENELKSGE